MKVYLTYGDNETEGPITDWDTFNRRLSEITAEHSDVRIERADVICDFCSWPRVAWTFQIAPGGEMYVAGTTRREHHMDADGQWAACDECKNFIMDRDWNGLRERSIGHVDSLMTPMRGLPDELIRVGVQQAHGYFSGKWDGSDPIPLQDDAEFLRNIGISEFDFEPYRKGFQS
jgi:hypothetical protein